MSKFLRSRPDWNAVAGAVSRRLGRPITIGLLQNVVRGHTRSASVYQAVIDICPEILPVETVGPVEGTDSVRGADGVDRLRGDLSGRGGKVTPRLTAKAAKKIQEGGI